MKRLLFIGLALITLGIQSCQSEYSERMKKAIELKKKHNELRNILNQSDNQSIKALMVDIEKEINYQAIVSGNENLFLKELWKK
ncbi:MAG: hypothetical protein HYU67_02945 [Flavobacteriia bacterium]|nr:hypothetical protein [Flavobacteriia bacterium]